ncbi:MAG: hypothetical protein J0H82_19210 [Alphaproteobacteria bacterium]|jgi:hypothetical protein|nr:hypothetical protein [Alphaproteobacteria bacterium]
MPNNIGIRATRRLSGRINGSNSGLTATLIYSFVEILSSDSFPVVIPANAICWRVKAFGGGGGGGGNGQPSVGLYQGGDGGSGGMADTGLVVGDGSAKTISGTIGAGGAGAAGSWDGYSTSGGTTSVSVGGFSLAAYGGGGGAQAPIENGVPGGLGGGAAGGAVNIAGGAGIAGGLSAKTAQGGVGGLGYPGRGIPSPSHATGSTIGAHGRAGGVLAEWWTAP